MEDRLREIERRLDAIEGRLGALPERPISGRAPLSADVLAAGGPAEAGILDRPFTPRVEEMVERHGLVLLAGMVSLILAGAMALRIMTMRASIPLALGASAGVAYCAGILAVAWLRFRRSAWLDGDTFAVLAMLILDALLVEVTHRPGGFSRPTAYVVLAASLVALSALAILAARSIPFAVALLAAPITGMAIGGSPFLHPYFAGVLAVTVVTGQAGMRFRHLDWARWGPAVFCVLYLLVLGGIGSAVARSHLPHHVYAAPLYALAIVGTFFALYALPAAAAALFRERALDRFEIVLSVGIAVLTYAVAAAILLALPGGSTAAGIVGVLLAALFYATAAASFVRHGSESSAFYALSAIAAVYAVAGLGLLLPAGAVLGAAWQALACAMAIAARSLQKRTLAIHAIVITILAFTALVIAGFDLSVPAGRVSERFGRSAGLLAAGVLALGTVAGLRTFRRDGEVISVRRARFRSWAQGIVLGAGVASFLGGLLPIAFAAGRQLLGEGAAEHAAPLWQTTMTGLLVLGALVSLAAGVRLRFGPAVGVAVALMGAGGLKLFAWDVMRIPPLHFVGSAGLLGIALITCSHLYRRYRAAGAPGAGDESKKGPN